jgi:uncharacterized C2H2 Zn-finger protein
MKATRQNAATQEAEEIARCPRKIKLFRVQSAFARVRDFRWFPRKLS